MAIEVKKGGRKEYTCAGCGSIINKGEPHMRTGSKDFKRYHKVCWAAKEAAKSIPKDTAPTAEEPEVTTETN